MSRTWKNKWEYAMYKGDELLAMGTKEEICEQLGIKRQTLDYYRTNAYKERVKNRKNKCASGYREVIRIKNDGF